MGSAEWGLLWGFPGNSLFLWFCQLWYTERAQFAGGAPVKASLAPAPETREVMDIRQAAHYMGISADSLYRYAATGFIPAFRLGNRWRFRKSRLDEWMDRRSGIEEPREPKLVRAQKKPVRSTRVLSRAPRTGS
jgi:excisionase family DNA binding protein